MTAKQQKFVDNILINFSLIININKGFGWEAREGRGCLDFIFSVVGFEYSDLSYLAEIVLPKLCHSDTPSSDNGVEESQLVEILNFPLRGLLRGVQNDRVKFISQIAPPECGWINNQGARKHDR